MLLPAARFARLFSRSAVQLLYFFPLAPSRFPLALCAAVHLLVLAKRRRNEAERSAVVGPKGRRHRRHRRRRPRFCLLLFPLAPCSFLLRALRDLSLTPPAVRPLRRQNPQQHADNIQNCESEDHTRTNNEKRFHG